MLSIFDVKQRLQTPAVQIEQPRLLPEEAFPVQIQLPKIPRDFRKILFVIETSIQVGVDDQTALVTLESLPFPI